MNNFKTPWQVENGNRIVSCEGETVAITLANNDDWSENAKRIVTCVNACSGISTEELKSASSGLVNLVEDRRVTCVDMAERNLVLKEQRDELVECLSEVINSVEQLGPHLTKALEIINKVRKDS